MAGFHPTAPLPSSFGNVRLGGNAPVAVQAELANEKLKPAQKGRLRQYADLIHRLLGPRHLR